MEMKKPQQYLEELISRYPILNECKKDIESAYKLIISCYRDKGKLLIAGNGGSSADSGHIVGELMKGFLSRRTLPDNIKQRLIESHREMGEVMAEKLQGALPAIDLTVHSPLITAFSNDVDGDLIYAQQIIGYGQAGDIFLGISTSGNARNILYGLYAAKAMGLNTIGLTGRKGGRMNDVCDITIRVPAHTTPEIQELHLPVYHTLCAMVEAYFFGDI
ncbi:MAG: SIS domain-containing protein [Caldicoprobacterales bacterium]|jgi:D-sedoheptulose 7-phosphate isomerase